MSYHHPDLRVFHAHIAEIPEISVGNPYLWAILGLVPALQFGVYQDFMLIISAAVANYVLLRRRPSNFQIDGLHSNHDILTGL